MRNILLSLIMGLSLSAPLFSATVLLGDISYQPDTPITGLNSVFLDNFTDAPDLGCSLFFPACSGLSISGVLSFVYLDSGGNTQNGSVMVGPTGPGSTPIYEFDPTQITFESGVLTGTISPATFVLGDGTTFDSTGSFVSDTLTPDAGFANISATSNEGSEIPEPAPGGLFFVGFMTLGAFFLRRRMA